MLLSFLIPLAAYSLLQQKEIIYRLRESEEQHDQHYHDLQRHHLVSLAIRYKSGREVCAFALSGTGLPLHACGTAGYPLCQGQQSRYIPHYL
jgi:hypothetical protein